MSDELRRYEPDEATLERIFLQRHYDRPTMAKVERYEWIRDAIANLMTGLVERCPPSRELSLALDELERAGFHANAAIARHEATVIRCSSCGALADADDVARNDYGDLQCGECAD